MSNLICKMIFSTSLGKAQEFAIEIKIWQQMWFFSFDAYIIYISIHNGYGNVEGGVGGVGGRREHIFGQYTLITPPPFLHKTTIRHTFFSFHVYRTILNFVVMK